MPPPKKNSTRTLDISDFAVPEGHHLQFSNLWGWLLVRDDNTASFRLSDRTFGDVSETPHGEETSDINYWTGGMISKAIEYVIRKKGTAIVLDCGCGPLNTAAFQIAGEHEESVVVHALDICHTPKHYKAQNLERHTQSATSLPFPDGSIDVVYSYELLRYLPIDERKTTLDEIVRVVAHGGHAVIDIFGMSPQGNRWFFEHLPTLHYFGPKFLGTTPYKNDEVISWSLVNTPNTSPGYVDLNPQTCYHVVHAMKASALSREYIYFLR